MLKAWRNLLARSVTPLTYIYLASGGLLAGYLLSLEVVHWWIPLAFLVLMCTHLWSVNYAVRKQAEDSEERYSQPSP